eukprot:scaffold17815_cov112-Isochrysis_galbana.AAC.4
MRTSPWESRQAPRAPDFLESAAPPVSLGRRNRALGLELLRNEAGPPATSRLLRNRVAKKRLWARRPDNRQRAPQCPTTPQLPLCLFAGDHVPMRLGISGVMNTEYLCTGSVFGATPGGRYNRAVDMSVGVVV